MNVLGIDVCRSSVVAIFLESKPSEPRQFYDDSDFIYCDANAEGISKLLALKPDVAVMEPTGVNYSQLWGTHLARAGVKVVLVGHTQLNAYRKTLDIEDKTDELDALALGCYYFDYQDNPRRFVQVRDFPITRIRSLVLRLAHLARVQSPIINRLRQDLAWQFPEVATVQIKRTGARVPLLLAWLAGERKSKRYDDRYRQSVGLGLTDTVKSHALRLCDIHREEIEIERELEVLVGDSRFAPYRRVFTRFGFGARVEALLLSQIYPLENYLDENNKPIVQFRRGKRSGKPTKRHKSRRRFEKALGCAPRERSSGQKKEQSVVGGSDLCRTALWQWMFTRIEVKRNRPDSDVIREIAQRFDALKKAKVPIALARSRVRGHVARRLFYALVSELFGDR